MDKYTYKSYDKKIKILEHYHEHYPSRTVHHAGDALHPYLPDKAFNRGAPDRLSPPALNQHQPHA